MSTSVESVSQETRLVRKMCLVEFPRVGLLSDKICTVAFWFLNVVQKITILCSE